MPTISRENTDALNAVITIELPKTDYLPKVEQKLKDYRKKASLKGFRPGQVPMNFIRQRFGDTIMSEEINEMVRTTLNDYFKAENLQFLGQPIPITPIDLNINQPKDIRVQFELGLTPTFDVQGLSLDNVLPYYDVEIDDEILEKEINNLRKRFGTGFDEEGIVDVQEDDLLMVDLTELDENGAVKEDGHSREEATVSLRDVKNETLKAQLLDATIGDTLDVNVYDLHNGEKEHVRKYLLDISPKKVVGDMFRLKIRSIRRVKLAELSETFFRQIFPKDQEQENADNEDVVEAEVLNEDGTAETPKNEEMTLEQFRERVREEIYKAYRRNVRNFFLRSLHKSLLELNVFELPDAFLKKWLKQSRNVPDQELEEGYTEFSRNVRWTLVRDKMAERFGVEVTKEDIENTVRMQVYQYFNYQLPPFGDVINNTVERVMNDKNEVQRRYEALLDERVLDHAAEEVGKDVKMMSREAFEAMLKTENADKDNDAINNAAIETAEKQEEEA